MSTKILTVKTDQELEDALNMILQKVYVLEKEVAKLDTEVGVITEQVFENPNKEGYDN